LFGGDGLVVEPCLAENDVMAFVRAVGDEGAYRGDGDDPVAWATTFVKPLLVAARFRRPGSTVTDWEYLLLTCTRA